MPTFRKYNFKCTDMNGNYLFDMPLTFPVYTVEEYNSFISTYDSIYASGPHDIIMGAGNSPGSITQYGDFILNQMGLKYFGNPYTLPVDSGFNSEWLSYILPNLPGHYDLTQVISMVPISEQNSDWIYRKFKITSGARESETRFSTYARTSDKYRAQFIGMNDTFAFKGSSYGSGTGGNDAGSYFGRFYFWYLVEDGSIGGIILEGYYNYSGGNSLKGTLRRSTANPDLNRWYKEIIKNNDDYTEVDPTDNDPYNPGGNSGTGGGTGNFDGTGDNVDFPSLPTLSTVDTGFITLFNPTAAQLKSLANYMWGDLFDLNTFKKIFADPMDCILGLSIVPVSVPDGGSKTVNVGNISTGITMTTAGSQYVSVDCGTLNVNEFWGAYLDYDPYTKAEIYLPYIGTHPIAVDDIMGKSVHVVYHVDILSGACTAFVKCGGSVLYEFIGQCSSSIPITGNDWTNVINGVLSVAGAIGTMVATGGAAAPMAAGVIASTAVNSMKPNVEKSGSMSGTGGMLAVQTPYLILTRPRQALPKNQNKFSGYPSFITRKLSDVSGYTEIESIHLENIGATEQELSEIESLLKGGVIL